MGKLADSQGEVPRNTNPSVISTVENSGDNKIEAQCLKVGGAHSGHK